MTKTHEEAWAEELKRWRAKRGYTQANAAEKLRVPERTLEEWEQERAQPSHKGPLRALMR